jgi:hypothetical protein
MVLIFQHVCRICPMNINDTTRGMAGIPTVMTRLPALRELNLSEVQGRSHQRLPAHYSCPSMRRATCPCYRRSRAVSSTTRISRMCAALALCNQRRVVGDSPKAKNRRTQIKAKCKRSIFHGAMVRASGAFLLRGILLRQQRSIMPSLRCLQKLSFRY